MDFSQNISIKKSAVEAIGSANVKFVRQKVNIYIFFIWLGAAFISILLFIVMHTSRDTQTFFNDADNLSFRQASTSNILNKRVKKQTEDAFVFVNINNKFIITRYPTHEKPGNQLPVPSSAITANPTIIVRRIKAPVKNKSEDFSIKPPPQ